MFRDDQGPIGKAVRKIESKYLDTMEQAWRYYHPGQRYNKKNEIIASSLKIGLLWGMSVQYSEFKQSHGRLKTDMVVDELTGLISNIMK